MTAEDLPDPATGVGVVETDVAEGTPAPPAELLLAARFDVRPGYVVHRARGAPSWLLTWTVAGSGRFRQGDVDVRARPGDLVALGPGVPHDYAVAAEADHWSFWWVHCQTRPAWQAWLRPHQVGGRLYRVAGVPNVVWDRLDEAFRRLHADARWSGQGPLPEAVGADAGDVVPAVAAGSIARELALGRVEEVVLLATAAVRDTADAAQTEEASVRRTSADVDPRIRRIEALLAADPAAPHTVASLADQVALSPSRLAHLFSAQTGRTPMRALREARMRHAARLLEATDLPVGRVAAASGFVSAFHFSRVFRERFGVPPGVYRSGQTGPADATEETSDQNSRIDGSSSPRSVL